MATMTVNLDLFFFIDLGHAELYLESLIHDISCHLSENHGHKILLWDKTHPPDAPSLKP